MTYIAIAIVSLFVVLNLPRSVDLSCRKSFFVGQALRYLHSSSIVLVHTDDAKTKRLASVKRTNRNRTLPFVYAGSVLALRKCSTPR